MKYLEIIADCTLAGRPVYAGQWIELDQVSQNDRAILTGAGLAREVERVEAADEESPKAKKAKKK